MIRRFLSISSLLLAAGILSACGGVSSDESQPIVTDPDAGTGFVATFKPDIALMPFPTDVWRSGSTDGTLNIKEFDNNPLLTQVKQMNMLDGFGLNSAIMADFSDPIDDSTLVLGSTVFVFKVAVAGVEVAPTLVVDHFSLDTGNFQGGRSVLVLEPVMPLDPLTTYAVIVTNGIESTEGTAASADTAFQAMLDAYPNNNTGAGETVEAIYDGMVHSLLDLSEGAGIGADNVVNAWTFTTQSISGSLDYVEATAIGQTNAIAPLLKDATTVYTAADLLGTTTTGSNADVYAGAIEMPYYLDPADPLTSYWKAKTNDANCQGAIAAGYIGEAPKSTTVYCSAPKVRSTISVPVLITVPNASMTGTCGADGLGRAIPSGVAIFQHGITQDRTNLLAIAGTLASFCHVGIAIDLPLHGITDTTSDIYATQGTDLSNALEAIQPGITDNLTEQTFDLDVDGDGTIDESGSYFINLESPITSRDALRQAAADLIHLRESIDTIDYDIAFASINIAFAGADFTGLPVRFIGHSLGGITGTTFLGVNTDTNLDAAVLASPGGDIGDLILNSASIYPEVEAGLAENGLTSSLRFFDEFFRNAQTLIEAGDPINYAAKANANHHVYMSEIVGGAGVLPDQVVPNSATQKLADAMGLSTVTTATIDNTNGVDGLVQFTEGDHGSILSPAASADATTELQTEAGVFVGGYPAPAILPGGHGILIVDTSVVKQ